MSTSAEDAGLLELCHAECVRLVSSGRVGRVVFTDGALPAAQPVNYLFDDGEVMFVTRNGSALAAATHNTVVAFEVDDIDPRTHVGWSVLAVGEAYEVTDAERLADLARRRPAAWAFGAQTHTIAIPLQHLTGRRLTLVRPP